jgi:hypothetical protein
MRAPFQLHAAAFLALLALSACGEPVRDDHYTNGAEPVDAPAAAPMKQVRAVRVGELGASFDACGGAGTTRNLDPGQSLAVRAAPFDSAAENGAVPSGTRFFVCNRSLDQKWLGIVYDENGTLAERCGVSSPATRPHDYDGPCRSGWVASAFVRLIAGGEQPQVANPPAALGNSGG